MPEPQQQQPNEQTSQTPPAAPPTSPAPGPTGAAPAAPAPAGNLFARAGAAAPAGEGATGATGSAPPAEGPKRPDWIPEKFWDPKAADPLAAASVKVANSYVELEKRLDTKREEVIAEYEKERSKGVPEKPEGYVLPTLEGIEFAGDVEKNPALNEWRKHCHDNKLTAQQFQEGVKLYVKARMADMPDLDAEAAKLGENANQRIAAVSQWAGVFFKPQQQEAVARLGETAAGIEALEMVMAAMGGARTGIAGQIGVPAEPPPTKDTLKSAMSDPRYWQGDADYVRKVEAMARQVAANNR